MKLDRVDEMEMYINLRSIRIAWAYTVLFLLAWSVYEVVKFGELGWPFMLMISQNLIIFVSKAVIRRRMTAGKNEE